MDCEWRHDHSACSVSAPPPHHRILRSLVFPPGLPCSSRSVLLRARGSVCLCPSAIALFDEDGGGAVPLRYLSVCSGIEAATVAWHPLGWQAAAFSEIEA